MIPSEYRVRAVRYVSGLRDAGKLTIALERATRALKTNSFSAGCFPARISGALALAVSRFGLTSTPE